MFAVRIVTADYYMANPLKDLDVCYSEFRENPVKRVPVVRIFGATPAGQKTCLHLHSIFPYIYVPYDGYGQQPERHLRQVAVSIDRALNVSMGNPSSSIQHVFKVSLVSGMPFYGYHAKERQFMKIYLYNPSMVKRVCELLQGGAVMNKIYQPHEAHIPYLLQLFIDYNLYGMNLVRLGAVRFRKSRRKDDAGGTPKDGSINSSFKLNCSMWRSPSTPEVQLSDSTLEGAFVRWEEEAIPSSLVLEGVEKQSTCELEADAVAADILNCLEMETETRNPGLQAIWEDEKQRRRDNNESSQVEVSDSQDREFVASTESERIYLKRLKEILRQNDLSVSLSDSKEDDEVSDMLPVELSLHSDLLTPEALQCTPANLVEVHKDSQPGTKKMTADEVAIVDEEAILSLLESSHTFQSSSQRLIQSPILESSQDHSFVHLLAGLEEDRYQAECPRHSSQQRFSGSCSQTQNSDDEEAVPELEKEEAELSLVMSQRWDSDIPDHFKQRLPGTNVNDSSSSEEQDFSEEEMDWNRKISLFTNLSIPQLDGAADENSDATLNEGGSRTHSSLFATDKILGKRNPFPNESVPLEHPSSAKNVLECKHLEPRQAHSLNKEDPTEKLFLLKSSVVPDNQPDLSLYEIRKESTYTFRYPATCKITPKTEISHTEADKMEMPSFYSYEKGISNPVLDSTAFESSKPQSRKKCISIKSPEKGQLSILQNHRSFSLCYAEMRNSPAKTELAIHQKGGSSFSPKKSSLVTSPGGDNGSVAPQGGEAGKTYKEGDLGELKIRYEDYQENKTAKAISNQQDAHYKFFPSVILSNCLNRPSVKCLGNSGKLDQDERRSRLKLSKKKTNVACQQVKMSASESIQTDFKEAPCTLLKSRSTQSAEKEDNSVLGSVDTGTSTITTTTVTKAASVAETARDNKLTLPSHTQGPAQLGSTQLSGWRGSKYTLRAKRKVRYEREDSEPIAGSLQSKFALIPTETLKDNCIHDQKSRKRRKMSNKEPPIIIKYIIINRFKGQKNMLVKMAKVNAEEEQVVLTAEKLDHYGKLAPVKQFWPKVPESTAIKNPICSPKAKRAQKQKAKVHSTAKKKTGGSPKVRGTTLKRKKTKPVKKQSTLATLSPPSLCYNSEVNDFTTEYIDVLSKLGYVSEKKPRTTKTSPPRCWSPSEPQAELPLTIEQKDAFPVNYPPSQEVGKLTKERGVRSRTCLRKSRVVTATSPKRKKGKVATKSAGDGTALKENQKQKPSSRGRRRKKKSNDVFPESSQSLASGKRTRKSCRKTLSEQHNELPVSGECDSSPVLFPEQETSLSTGQTPSSQLPMSSIAHGYVSGVMDANNTVNFSFIPERELTFETPTGFPFERSTSQCNQDPSDQLGQHKSQPSHSQSFHLYSINKSTEESAFSHTPLQSPQAAELHPQSSCLSSRGQNTSPPCSPATTESDSHGSDVSCQNRLLSPQQLHSSIKSTYFQAEIPSPLLLRSLQSLEGKTPGKSSRRPSKKLPSEPKEKDDVLGHARFTPIRIKPLTSSTLKSKVEAKTDSALHSSYKNGERLPNVTEPPSGIAVLKELLQKRQKKVQEGTALQDPSGTPLLNVSGSCSTEKPAKIKRAPLSYPRKSKNPKNQTPKEKPRNRKKNSAKEEEPVQTDCPLSDDSPAFPSDPGFESCYSFEDSLSPELPHNYNFDINTIGQTEFCSLYMGSQFVLADKNLPQKFLSDVIQEPVPAIALGLESMGERFPSASEEFQHHHGVEWLRTSPLSPDLFDRSSAESRELLHTHLSASLLDSDSGRKLAAARIVQSRQTVDSVSKNHLQPCSQGLFDDGKNPLTSFDPFLPLPLNNMSFVDLLGSPAGDLVEGSEALTATPSSSPRSISSLSQLKSGSHTLRSTGGAHILKPLMSPPTRDEIMSTLLELDLAETAYQEPFCSDPSDAPGKPREIGGRVLTVETKLADRLSEFEGDCSSEGLQFWKTAFSVMTQPGFPTTNRGGPFDSVKGDKDKHLASTNDQKVVVMPCKSAPSRQRVQLWVQAKKYDRCQRGGKEKNEGELPVQLAGVSMTSIEEPAKGVEVHSDTAVDPEISSQLATVHRGMGRGDLSLLLQVSPVQSSDTQNSSGDYGSQPLETCRETGEEYEDYCGNYRSPDSPVLSPWDFDKGEEKGKRFELRSPRLLETHTGTLLSSQGSQLTQRRQDKQLLSPSPIQHSTPVHQRRKSKGSSEPLCSTPITTEPRSQKLSQRSGSKANTLNSVLLTTQVKNQFAALNVPKKDSSQIEGPSLNSSYGFKVSMQNLQDAKALHEVQHLTLLSMELHASTRRDLEPDPDFDPVCALFYCITSDALLPDTDNTELCGAIVVDKDYSSFGQGSRATAPLLVRSGISGLQVTYASDEKQLFQEIVSIMRRFDPDILLGYEVQMHSWGYLLQRASAVSVDLCQQLSRVPGHWKDGRSSEWDEYDANTKTEINIVGRIVLNVWRMMKTEVMLTSYSFENVAFHALHQRFPLYTPRVLSDWFDSKTDLYRWKMVDHYISRVRGSLQLLEQHDLIGRTSELARLFGIQFDHVLTRGSRYRVESMMLRVAKPMNYISVTTSRQQRVQMRCPQCIPLVMEPESCFYSNSVVVLDFQSLYPSIVIAYNYCFSTCLGHVEHLGSHDEFKFGCTSLRVPPDLLYLLRNDITVSPNGTAFVKPSVRKGVLPSMLEEMIKTRIMVKQSMKAYKHDKAVTRMLDARQLGLKINANATFDYTSARVSGRMPCVEVGDSIVHKARETLERAIKLVNDTKKWGAHVVYGDTDSMFVLLKGATKEQAFKIGQEIAEAVTATNPKPVKLKFEKVYLPCVLQTKKKYMGYMYESLDQKDPVFDAKGIETVRRDACPAVAKILERSIKLLFETRDISQIKQYVQRQCLKVLEGKVSIQDLTFAKEYRGSNSYQPGACVPALELTRRMLSYDRRSEPRVGERVPYVIVYGMPGVPLIQLVRRPLEVLQDPSLRLNAAYYITKQILPPLQRIFTLIGVNVFSWYQQLPRTQKASSVAGNGEAGGKGTISRYFTTLHCPVCDELTQLGICSRCRSQPQHVGLILLQEIRDWEHRQAQLLQICKNCTGCVERQVQCVSLACPVLYKLSRVSRELSKAPYLRQLLNQF
ncbi:DNA polymerase zeta catalytic subunit-like [Polyodon spathula]|uniref:DNA polymerase zeta catalytic subunit-like n=1 Tax=Polyodon spathula TaxID=7913 RepID=UPI001B7EAB6C|nr:DNA polymerase zeta catalytic subunit-like [Polyodon spathula]